MLIFPVMVIIFLVPPASAVIEDRVVASIDNEAITMSELDEAYRAAAKLNPDETREEVLNAMINRTLLLREARKLRIEAGDEAKLLEEFIHIKIRGFIIVGDEEIREYYDSNKDRLGRAKFEEVRDKVREYLIEEGTNSRLRALLEDLKAKAVIRINP